jgi:uncharacterized protein (TIRG00374 family)
VKAARAFLTIALGVAILFALLMWLNSAEAWTMLRQADWPLLVVAVGFTALSYFCLSLAYVEVNRVFNVAASTKSLLTIGFLSTALGEFMSMGGISMHSARLAFLKKEGVPYADALAASLCNTYLNAVILLALTPFGLLRILHDHRLGGPVETSLIVGTCLMVVVLAAFGFAMFRSSVRQFCINLVKGAAEKTGKLDDMEKLFLSVDHTFDRGALQFRRHRKRVVWMFALMLADWFAGAAALWFCLDALAAPLPPGVLLTGFCTGMAVAFASFIPGGLGVQEGSMTVVYVAFGVDAEQAVLGALAFRLVYQVLPLLASLPLYRRLMPPPAGDNTSTRQ